MIRSLAPLGLLLAVALWAEPARGASDGAESGPSEPISDGRYAMGTVLEMRLEGAAADRALLERLFTRVAALEAISSRHDPESALSRLNDSAGGPPQASDPELLELVDASLAYARLTRGAFDPTVGPLVALWWESAERGHAPRAAELARVRARVGAERVELDRTRGRLRLAAGSSLDLGAIAKGWTLDDLARELRAARVPAALLSFGQSSTHAHGAPAKGDGWRLALRGLDGGIAGVVTLRDQALSVSGSYGQPLVIGERRYSHVIDPRTGRPGEGPAVAVVVSRSGERAEAFSTALLVLGADEGIPLLESFGDAEALLLTPAGRFQTSGFVRETGFEPYPPQAMR